LPVDLPVRLHAESAGASQVRLWFEALPGHSYIIEASPTLDLWTPVATNLTLNGRVEYLYPLDETGLRFFRARPAP
jgi:hypothetical protein